MPYSLRRNPKGGWDIVRKDTGAKVAHSSTMKDAKASMRIREAAHAKKMQG